MQQAEILMTSSLSQITMQTGEMAGLIRSLQNISLKGNSPKMQKLRWFMLPQESILFQQLRGNVHCLNYSLPFQPIPFNKNADGGKDYNGYHGNWNSIPSLLYRAGMTECKKTPGLVNKLRGSCEISANKRYGIFKSDGEHRKAENQIDYISLRDSGFSDDSD